MSTKENLIASGAKLIAKTGYEGVSVRKICADADTTMNMIHHFFGSKHGLLEAIVDKFNDSVFEPCLVILESQVDSKKEFEEVFKKLFEKSLEAYLENREILLVVIREEANPKSMVKYLKKVTEFFREGQKKGYVRDSIDVEMISGFMNDRIINQAQFAPWVKKAWGVDVYKDKKYREQWCASSIDLILRGLMT